MNALTCDQLREKYLSFFESKGCTRRPSDVLVPRGDKSVLFTVAGMAQFKEQFLGQNITFPSATTCQKCIRTNDIANVGVTAYHHTFFEMLGNFSFGDYFKPQAIAWAWEFLTSADWLGMDPDKLSVTVYRDDEAAYDIWANDIGLRPERISREDEDENFWPASAPSQGPDGVCGPCSEIYYHADGWTPDNEKAVEIWNLVFTQFERQGDPPDNLKPLPKKNIDTGMGLERTAAVLQNVRSNYEIDTLRPLCEAAAKSIGKTYQFDAPHGRACRRIADHVRAVTMCIHEGVQPGREKQEYIVRLLLRRAMLEGYLLGQEEPFLHTLVGPTVDIMQRAYPDLTQTRDSVAATVREEEDAFLHTIDRGMGKYKRVSTRGVISGADAFTLHTQDGFIIDLVEELAIRDGYSVDREEFDRLIREHEAKSGTGGFDGSVMASGPLDAIRSEHGETEFVGYEQADAEASVLGLLVDGESVDEATEASGRVGVVLGTTPFYAEAGGQVGDMGTIRADGVSVVVDDTQKEKGLYVHIGRVSSGTVRVGDTVTASIISARRAGIERAHSATHLLHFALRQTLGDKAVQRGSKVQEDELRFDFSHNQSISPAELLEIESEVNARIAEASPVTTMLTDIDSARAAGAMALFGEKYPDEVRVVSIGDYSKELCGGCHLRSSGQVGPLRIVGETLVAKGVRRISAITGPRAIASMREQDQLLAGIAASVKAPTPADIPQKIAQLQDELKTLRGKLAGQAKEAAASLAPQLLADAPEVGGAKIVTHVAENIDRDQLRDLADRLRSGSGDVCVLIGAEIDGKAALLAAVSKPLTKRGVKAGDCVKAAAKEVQGGGGGRPDLAEAGGKDPANLPAAIAAGEAYYRAALGG